MTTRFASLAAAVLAVPALVHAQVSSPYAGSPSKADSPTAPVPAPAPTATAPVAAPPASPVATTTAVRENRMYAQALLGAFVPQSKDFEALDPGLAAAARFGARVNPYVSVEGEFGFYRASASLQGERNVVQGVPLSASLRLRWPGQKGEVSAFAGGGLHLVQVHRWFEVAGMPFWVADRDTAFGYHYGASAAFAINPMFRVGAEVRYSSVSVAFDQVKTEVGGLWLNGSFAFSF